MPSLEQVAHLERLDRSEYRVGVERLLVLQRLLQLGRLCPLREVFPAVFVLGVRVPTRKRLISTLILVRKKQEYDLLAVDIRQLDALALHLGLLLRSLELRLHPCLHLRLQRLARRIRNARFGALLPHRTRLQTRGRAHMLDRLVPRWGRSRKRIRM